MAHRDELLAALATTTAARRDYMAELDDARSAQLAPVGMQLLPEGGAEPLQPAAPTSEELIQTVSALVRQLDNAARELTDAIRTIDQRERVAEKLR